MIFCVILDFYLLSKKLMFGSFSWSVGLHSAAGVFWSIKWILSVCSLLFIISNNY